jgi:ABC-type antimicrobial peptide transport system permease subunit
VKPVLGRTFVPGEERATGDAAAVVVLSHRTWSERFGADPGIVGSAIRVAGIPFTVIGVAPEGFAGTTVFLPSGFYIPMGAVPMIDARVPRDFLDRRGDGGLDAVGRLVPTATIERASAEAALVAAALQRQYPETNRRLGMLVSFEPDARATEYFYLRVLALMLVLLAVAVLLVACANVAGLLTSRAPARSREIAVRIAVGGGRTRLIRQLMTECVLIAVAGGALGFALGYGGIRSFRAFQVVSNVGVALTFTLDRRALLVGLVVAGLSALLAGAIPAWRSTRIRDLSGTLRNTAAPDRTSRLWGRRPWFC